MQNPAFLKKKMKTEEGLLERGSKGRAGEGRSGRGHDDGCILCAPVKVA